MKRNINELRERTIYIRDNWVQFTIGFFAAGGYIMGGLSIIYIASTLGYKEVAKSLSQLIFGSWKFLSFGLVILLGFQFFLWMIKKLKMRELERKQKEDMEDEVFKEDFFKTIRELIREELKVKRKKK